MRFFNIDQYEKLNSATIPVKNIVVLSRTNREGFFPYPEQVALMIDDCEVKDIKWRGYNSYPSIVVSGDKFGTTARVYFEGDDKKMFVTVGRLGKRYEGKKGKVAFFPKRFENPKMIDTNNYTLGELREKIARENEELKAKAEKLYMDRQSAKVNTKGIESNYCEI